MKRKSKKKLIISIGFGLLLLGAIAFIQFTAIGYRVTVPLRGFHEVKRNVYVDRSYTGEISEILEIVNAASARLLHFWGDIESAPTIIISDNEKTIQKLGGDHDTTRVVLFGAHSYISISDEYLNVDIMAHEMTHAELYERLYKGKALPQTLIPVWFDEGVATQNDDREQYSEEMWQERTNFGENTIHLVEMDTAAQFYAGDVEARRFRYLISKHEVKSWIDRNGMEALLTLIEQVNQGAGFHALYNAQ